MPNFYRIVSNSLGIYEAVGRDCPSEDPRQQDKPDGAWLPKVGRNFPGAISFWTEQGLHLYSHSGLMHWHASVVRAAPIMLIALIDGAVLYSDPYQVICHTEEAEIQSAVPLLEFLSQRSAEHKA
jgi:hypothetical protein